MSTEQVTTAELREAIRELESAEKSSQKAMASRASMGPGASHSRKGAWTTANGLEISTKVMRGTGTNG